MISPEANTEAARALSQPHTGRKRRLGENASGGNRDPPPRTEHALPTADGEQRARFRLSGMAVGGGEGREGARPADPQLALCGAETCREAGVSTSVTRLGFEFSC